MNKRFRILVAGGAGMLLLAALLLALTVGGAAGKDSKAPPPHGKPAPKGSVEFFITATEAEAENEIKEVLPPTIDPKKLSDAYEFEMKKGASTFEVKQDVFIPSAITVHQGDTVALRIFVVEGKHKVWVEDPDGNELIKVKKFLAGREYLYVFKATRPGIYHLNCDNHDPTMKVIITALHKGA